MGKGTAVNPNQKIQIGDLFVSDRDLKEMTEADMKTKDFFPQIKHFFHLIFVSFTTTMKKTHLH